MYSLVYILSPGMFTMSFQLQLSKEMLEFNNCIIEPLFLSVLIEEYGRN